MAEDNIDDVGISDALESSEAEAQSNPAEELSSDIKKAVDGQRDRSPDGKFKVADDLGKAAAKGVATGSRAGASRAAEPGREAPKESSGSRPPSGYSVATKQAWDGLPEAVRADITKREADIDNGLKMYGGLREYAEEANRNGTTIQGALKDYVAVETELRKDFLGGVEFLCHRLGVQPQALFRAMAQRYGASQQTNGQAQRAPQQHLDPNAIAAHAANVIRSEMEHKSINSDISSFSANPANRFFGNVRQDMAVLVQAGKAANLQEAYEAACWLNPEIRAILIEETASGRNRGAVTTASRAQNAAKAVSGAPSNSRSGEAPKRRNLAIDDEIRSAISAQRGAA